VSFLDNFSKFCWVFPIVSKSDVHSIFLQFQANIERQLERKIKMLQTGEKLPNQEIVLVKFGINSDGIKNNHQRIGLCVLCSG
jgi:hypothetical protein